jgi:hypothetical protein
MSEVVVANGHMCPVCFRELKRRIVEDGASVKNYELYCEGCSFVVAT